jgi:hypothetical protein
MPIMATVIRGLARSGGRHCQLNSRRPALYEFSPVQGSGSHRNMALTDERVDGNCAKFVPGLVKLTMPWPTVSRNHSPDDGQAFQQPARDKEGWKSIHQCYPTFVTGHYWDRHRPCRLSRVVGRTAHIRVPVSEVEHRFPCRRGRSERR